METLARRMNRPAIGLLCMAHLLAAGHWWSALHTLGELHCHLVQVTPYFGINEVGSIKVKWQT